MSLPDVVRGASSLGPAFGGDVHSMDLPSVRDLALNNRALFEKTGFRSLLRSFNIPSGFYDKLSSTTQERVFVDQAANVEMDRMMLLERGDRIVYCGKSSPIGHADPEHVLGLSPQRGWKKIREDLGSGTVRYFHNIKELVKGEYLFGVYLTLPIFYSGPPMIGEGGFHRVQCANGAIDKIHAKAVSFKLEAVTPELVLPFVAGVVTALTQLGNHYDGFFEWLKSARVSPPQAGGYFERWLSEGKFPKTLLMDCTRHLDQLSEGHEVPASSPQEVRVMDDIFQMLTFYSRSLPSMGSQRKAEALAFEAMKELFPGKFADGKVDLTLALPQVAV